MSIEVRELRVASHIQRRARVGLGCSLLLVGSLNLLPAASAQDVAPESPSSSVEAAVLEGSIQDEAPLGETGPAGAIESTSGSPDASHAVADVLGAEDQASSRVAAHESVSSTPAISVTYTASTPGLFCLPPLFAMTSNVFADENIFRLRVTISTQLCEPINATAVIYAMPGNGVAWPQQLVETLAVPLGPAGVTDIVFRKSCAAQQFDVVVGETPSTISPTGPWHGPLLFPFDTNTALQHWGCATTTTTSTTTTTTTTSTTTTSTTTTEASTTVAPTTAAPIVEPAAVLGTNLVATTVAPSAVRSASVSSSSLAVTGVGSGVLAVFAGLAVLSGLALLATSVRRRG